jgi:multidrug efflux pump subunit AcrB
VTIAIAKKKGANAVGGRRRAARGGRTARDDRARDMELVITRNYGLTANEKVNELVEGWRWRVIVVALLTLGLGWREALIVAVAVPVVFGLTLAVNLLLASRSTA